MSIMWRNSHNIIWSALSYQEDASTKHSSSVIQANCFLFSIYSQRMLYSKSCPLDLLVKQISHLPISINYSKSAMTNFQNSWSKQSTPNVSDKLGEILKPKGALKPRIEQATRSLQNQISKLDGMLTKLKQREQKIGRAHV